MYVTEPWLSSEAASAVETTRLICTAPAPAAAGQISDSSRLTSGSSRGRRSLRLTPAERHAQISQTSCKAPAMLTPIAWLRAVISGSAE